MKKLIVFFLIVPFFVSAKVWTMPSGKSFEEKISWGRTLSGLLIQTTEWIEINGAIRKAVASDESQEDTIKGFIRSLSSFNGIDGEFMVSLAGCESGFNINAIGDSGRARGLYQWWKKSWNHYNDVYNTSLDRESWQDQVRMSVNVVRDYGTDDWMNCRFWIKNGRWPKR